MAGRPSNPTARTEPVDPLLRDPATRSRVGTVDLANWLQDRVSHLAGEWSEEISARGPGQASLVDRVVGRFVARLVSMLPWLLGPQGEQFQPLWIRASELFGVVAAKRGLAAGEVIEEFQILRRLLIRDLYRGLPIDGPPSLRDVLRLNRIMDRGVTHASVGHTDAMFFQLLESHDTPVEMAPEVVAQEADAQLELIREEMEAILGRALH